MIAHIAKPSTNNLSSSTRSKSYTTRIIIAISRLLLLASLLGEDCSSSAVVTEASIAPVDKELVTKEVDI